MGTHFTSDNELGCGGYALLLAGLFVVGFLVSPSPIAGGGSAEDGCPLSQLCSRDLPDAQVQQLSAALDGTASSVIHLNGGRIGETLSSIEYARLLRDGIGRRGLDRVDRTGVRRDMAPAELTAGDAERDHGGSAGREASIRMAAQAGL